MARAVAAFRALSRRFLPNERGVALALTAISLPVLIGFASLGVEVGHWYLMHREMQGAADAAAISAAAEYIAQYNTNPSSTSYQTVGQSYASTNGFTIPVSNVCLITPSGDNCGSVRSLDSRPITCLTGSTFCLVVEITETPSAMLLAAIPGVPTLPTLKARAIVSQVGTPTTTTTTGTDCVLALANATNAVQVDGNGDLNANCGISIDGGRDQNASGTILGGIHFNGGNAKINVSALVVASNSTECPEATAQHCYLFNPTTSPLPASAVHTNTATPDPYASLAFPTPPSGVKTGGVASTAQGSGYTNGTRTFTVVGGTGTPAKFTATVSGGRVTGTPIVTDPGAYTVFPTGAVSVTPDTGGGSGATFTLTQGCFTWISGGTPLSGRKYCSINLNGAGTTNFPAGNYYIAGGDGSCVGFCVSSANATVTSDSAGVTFYLTNGEGTGTFGTASYAQVAITSGTVSLCAPNTNCGTTCTVSGSCLLFFQNPAAPATTSLSTSGGGPTPSNTNNTFSGNGTRTLSGLIYIPRQTFSESGNGPILGCLGVVAKYADIAGTPTFSNGCLPGNGIGGTTVTVTNFSTPLLFQ
jgi:Flp pilus assembly protein TadG